MSGAGELSPLIGADEIARRIDLLAEQVNTDYADKDLLLICVLKGAFIFCADLVRRIRLDPEIDFVRIKSYGNNDASSGKVEMLKDVECRVQGRDILVVEDIVDSGLSMAFLLRELAGRDPNSLRLAALIDKRERRQTAVHVDYPCFILDAGFIVGYGLDYAERHRNTAGIFSLKSG
ncbi:MAG: hypoxanthine phosphoribosyltransferase [Desulfovibrio sp.]|jgi:hypoxanthine phosphoribosyltransferase|nr:hypoxanthine phosphoribosyltransferase [Desulfovibrio sp.]